MLRVGLLMIVGLIAWAAVSPSADSKAHPTEFLERSAIGRSALANWNAYKTLPAELDRINEGQR